MSDILEAHAGVTRQDERRQLIIQAFSEMLAPAVLKTCESCTDEELSAYLTNALTERYTGIEGAFWDSGFVQSRARMILLKVVDKWWMEHMDNMEHLRQGIGLVTYAQRDPLDAYKWGAFQLFDELNRNIRYDTALSLLSISEVKMRT